MHRLAMGETRHRAASHGRGRPMRRKWPSGAGMRRDGGTRGSGAGGRATGTGRAPAGYRSAMAAPALLEPRRSFEPRRPAGEPTWGATVAAAAITGLLVLLVAAGLGDLPGLTRAAPPPAAATTADERVTWVEAPPVALPEPDRTTAAGAGAVAAPRTVAPPVATPTLPTVPRTAAPPLAVPPARRDTVAPGGAATAPGRTPSAIPPVPRAARPGATLGGAPSSVRLLPPTACVGPCLGGTTGAVRTGPPPLDSAGRAERLRELGRSAPALARNRGGELAGPPAPEPPRDRTRPVAVPFGAVSVPLPGSFLGGGPSAEERRRTRELDAQVSSGLARVRARVDSARADSLRRVDSLRKARGGPP